MKKAIYLAVLATLVLASWIGADRGDLVPLANAQTSAPQRGGFMAQRERLISELHLDEKQQGRLDAITMEMAPKFLATSAMGPSERASARAKLAEETQQKINAMLTPDQRASYELWQAQRTEAKAKAAAASGKATGTAPGS